MRSCRRAPRKGTRRPKPINRSSKAEADVGRHEEPIGPDGPVQRFAEQLRELRREAGSPSYRSMDATARSDCPPGIGTVRINSAAQAWSVGTHGGWTGDHCLGEYYFVADPSG